MIPRPYKELIKRLILKYFAIIIKNYPNKIHWQIGQEFSNPLVRTNLFNFFKLGVIKQYTISLENYESEEAISLNSIAIHIHVYYLDVFEQIIEYLQPVSVYDITIFLTYPFELENEVRERSVLVRFNIVYLPVDNRGRDVLPFLQVLPMILEQKSSVVIKLHTKKANIKWAEDLFGKILSPLAFSKNIELFEKYKTLGILVPKDHLLPMSLYYGKTSAKVKKLCNELGATKEQMENLLFAAGTMFIARPEALANILELGITSNDFEAESGQQDGTFAHALERIFCLCAELNGYYFADTGSTHNTLSITVTTDYHYI